METKKSKKILLVSGLGILDQHVVATAIALRRFPGADIAFAAMGVLPDILEKRALANPDEVHLLGIGLAAADPGRLAKAFRGLRDLGAKIFWYSAGYDVPPEVPEDVRSLFEPHVGPEGGLAAFIASELGVKAEPLLALLDDKPKTETAKQWQERFRALGWRYSNEHDYPGLETTVKDLAEAKAPPDWGEGVQTLLRNYRIFGARELQASGPKMRTVRKEITRIARKGVRRVLVTGESGVGKETVAQQLHVQSGRPGPYLSFNCATVARDLVESRLFGHVKGAFTGADEDKPGLFRSASGGTLFLDEIAELPLDVQGILLRVLQDGVVQPMGSPKEEKVDVLVVAATNRDLGDLVRRRLFREDLYWRLSVFTIRMPPLREREGDIAATARRVWRSLAPDRKPLSKEDIDAIVSFEWPGNVRELSNVLERAAVFEDRTIPQLVAEERAEVARLAAFEPLPGEPPPPAPLPLSPPPTTGAGESLAEVVRAHVRRVWERHNRNLTTTAAALGVSRNTARRHLGKAAT
jgi:transcriptional regulator with PAS, ATPase and Fis domain